MAFWLVKTDPDTYSWDDFVKEGKTAWDGVRNYQARNNLKEMKLGESVLMYHSQTDKSIIGTAIVTKEHFQDPTTEDDRWVAVELTAGSKLPRQLSLDEIKTVPELDNIALLKIGRLSVIKLTDEEYGTILRITK